MKHIKAIVNNCIKKQDNRGFSLVEMVAALVIMSLIGLGVGGLIVSGSKYFRRSTAETQLQEEAQLVKNYLNNMIVDTALAIGRIENLGGVSGDSCVFVCATEEVRFIAFDASANELRYLETTLTDVINTDSTTGKTSISADKILKIADNGTVERSVDKWPLLAEHVTSFDVSNSLKNVKKNQFRVFNCAMEFEVRERTYKTKHTINLRNDIFEITDTDLTKAYEFIDLHKATVTNVVIDPLTASASRGGEFQFHSYVQGLNFPSQEVTWKVSGSMDFPPSESSEEQKSTGTTIDANGKLTIASDEPCSILYVKATSVLDNTQAANAMIRIATLNGATIDVDTEYSPPDNLNRFSIGETVSLFIKPDVTFVDNSGDAADSSLVYEWDVVDIYIPVSEDSEQEDDYVADLPLDESENYHIEKNEKGSRLKDRVIVTPKGEKCEVYITNNMPPNSIIHVTASVTMSGKKVVAGNAPYDIKVSDKYASGLKIITEGKTVNRKGSVAIYARVANHTGAPVTWELISSPYLKGKVGFDKACTSTTTTSSAGEGDSSRIYLYANNSIDYTLENQQVELKATYRNTLTNQVLEERETIIIPPVTIAFDPKNAAVVVGNPERVDVMIKGLEADADDITLRSSNYIKNMVGPIYSSSNQKMVLSVTPPEPGKEDKYPRYQTTVITATMKSSPNVKETFRADVFKSNINIDGKNYVYIPVPGDPLFPPASKENTNLPEDGKLVPTMTELDNIRYFVEGDTWGVKVPNPKDTKTPFKYYYREIDKDNKVFTRK